VLKHSRIWKRRNSQNFGKEFRMFFAWDPSNLKEDSKKASYEERRGDLGIL